LNYDAAYQSPKQIAAAQMFRVLPVINGKAVSAPKRSQRHVRFVPVLGLPDSKIAL